MLLPSRILKLILITTIFCSFTGTENTNWSTVLKGKIDKALTTVYENETINYRPVSISTAVSAKTKETLTNKLFKVYVSESFKGYVYVSQAPSMKNVFDYLVVFTPEFEIKKAKILIYREQHGRQIGAARWLNQFKGMTVKDSPELGAEVDGISGATISAKGMTKAVNDLLSALSEVKENGIN